MAAGDQQQTKPPPTRLLLKLAREKFATLSPAEEELFQATQEGRVASTLTDDEKEDNPANAANWNADRVVRGECIAWLCTDPQASALVTYRGLKFCGMRLDGELDLSKAEIKFSLSAHKCAFSGSVLLRDTQVQAVCLTTCYIKNVPSNRIRTKAFDAEGAKIAQSLFLRRCDVTGEVSLLGTAIGRDLDCSGTEVSNRNGNVFNADGARIEGDLLFGESFKANGCVRLLGATVDGSLLCDGVQFLNPKGDAFIADGTNVGGDVFFGSGAEATGLVSLAGMTIGGNLECGKAHFSKLKDEALTIEGSKIGGDILFKDNFKAEGEVKLLGVTIGGGLNCECAQFINLENDAFTADVLRINGDATFGDGFKAKGQVRLFGVIIGGDLNCECAQFSNPKADALSADGARIEGDVKFSDGVKAKGRVGLSGATIRGDLDCAQTQFSNPREDALNADGAKIEGSVFFKDNFVVEGEVRLIGATIGGDLECDNAQFSNLEGDALSADRAKIAGDITFGGGFTAEGNVRFLSATIGGDLECDASRFSSSEDPPLNAEGAKIEGKATLCDDFQIDGCVNFANSEITRQLDLRGFTPSNRASIDLRSAKAGVVRDDKANWLPSRKALLDGFSYERIHVEGILKAADWVKWLHPQRPERKKPFLRRSYKQIITLLRRIKQWLRNIANEKTWFRNKEPARREQFLPQPYEQLASVLRKMGHEREARLIMIEKNRERARFTRFLRQRWWWYNFFGRVIDYGYAPWRAFVMSIAMILIGTFLFHLGFSHGLVSPTRENVYVKDPPGQLLLHDKGARKLLEDYPVFNAFVYSLESFIPLIKFDQSANWMPNANRRAEISNFHLRMPFTGRFLRYYLYCHIAAGWLLTSLWVGAVTGLVKS